MPFLQKSYVTTKYDDNNSLFDSSTTDMIIFSTHTSTTKPQNQDIFE
jgi:hypothetical protein